MALDEAWKKVDRKAKKLKQRLELLMDPSHNMKAYRYEKFQVFFIVPLLCTFIQKQISRFNLIHFLSIFTVRRLRTHVPAQAMLAVFPSFHCISRY